MAGINESILGVPGFVLSAPSSFLHWIPSTTPQGCKVGYLLCSTHSVGIPVIYWELPPLSRPWRWRQRLASATEATEVRQTRLPLPGSKNTACDSDLTNGPPARIVHLGRKQSSYWFIPRTGWWPCREVLWQQSAAAKLQLESSVSTLCSRRVTAATN